MSIKLCCCLCVRPCSEYKLLENELGESNEIYEITVKFFDPMLLAEGEHAQLYHKNKLLCQECWCQINDFHDFQQTIIKARKLEELDVKQLPSFEVKQEAELPIMQEDFNKLQDGDKEMQLDIFIKDDVEDNENLEDNDNFEENSLFLNENGEEDDEKPLMLLKTSKPNDKEKKIVKLKRFRSPSMSGQQQAGQQNTQQPSSSCGSSTSGGTFELELEDSIQAVFVKKDGQNNKISGGNNQNTTNVSVANNGSTQIGNTTLTTYSFAAAGTAANKDDDDNRIIRTQNGTCMSLAEYKKRNNATGANQIVQTSASAVNAAGGIKPLPQTVGGAKISLPATGQSLHSVPVARVAPQKHIVNKEPGGAVGGVVNTTSATTQINSGPPAGSSVYQISHNNYEIQTQRVLQNRAGQQMAEKDRNSAKMLVILVSGELRLITFNLPRKSCTVQVLLKQVRVPFDNNTTIQCVENPGDNFDFVVTVGFSVQESVSELISRAEQTLQISRQQESLQQNPGSVANKN